MLVLDLVNTIAVAGLVLFAGYGLRRAIPALARLNIPAPVVGGLVVAVAMTISHSTGTQLVRFDTTLQTPLQNAFFTSIGFGASYQLLRLGGPLVLRFLVFASLIAIL
jgi:glutamate:Na+ symporter, ESS family